ncbi:MAG: uroporphyrinogen-III synthase [Acidimicrobiaceae bacterium]|nr:uroporphyrinogen-III synthase [Acidimicrobiaceae bacterium]
MHNPRSCLAGLRVLICRPFDQAKQLAQELEAVGAEAVRVPVIAIADPEDGGVALREAMRSLAEGDWLVLTSRNGAVRAAAAAPQLPLPERVRVAAIGPGTAQQATAAGLTVDLIPKRSVAEGLLDEFPSCPPDATSGSVGDGGTRRPRPYPTDLAGSGLIVGGSGFKEGAGSNASSVMSGDGAVSVSSKVVLARAAVARAALPEGLRALGWEVVDVPAYRTLGVLLTAEQHLEVANADAVVFTSSSTVKHLLTQMDVSAIPKLVVSIGPATTITVLKHGLQVTVQATEHTTQGVVEALCSHVSSCWPSVMSSCSFSGGQHPPS